MSFDVDLCQKYVESLIDNDEVERALLVLDNVPAEHRDKPPQNLVELRTQIVAALCTTHAYMSSGLDSKVVPETAIPNLHYNLRGRLIEEEVKRYNAQGKVPHIVDVGPGEYWIPLALQQLGHKFTYWDIAVDENTQAVAHPLLKDVRVILPNKQATINHQHRGDEVNPPRVFLALEIIEHLPEVRDLATECLRHCGAWPERIHLSTPMYCFDTDKKDWKKPCGLPHLRAYTPSEFLSEARRIFPGYEWQVYFSRIMSLRGLRKDVADDVQEPLVRET